MKTKASKSIGEKIGTYTKYQREKRHHSLNEFAKGIDVTTSFLLRLERGEYFNVKFDVIEKIAKGFEMTTGDFLYKCNIIEASNTLPPIDYYLKEAYQFPEEAIEDVKLLIELLKVKYKKERHELRELHKAYWEKK